MKSLDNYINTITKLLPMSLSAAAVWFALRSNRSLLIPSVAAAIISLATLFIRTYQVKEAGRIKVTIVELIRKNILKKERYLMILLVLAALLLFLIGALSAAGSLLFTAVLLLTVDLELFSSNAGSFINEHLLGLSKKGIVVPEAGKLFGLKASSYAVFEKSNAVYAGAPKVASIIPVKELSGETSLAIALALVMNGEDEFAKALRAEAAKMKAKGVEVLDIQIRPDLGGIEGTLLGRRVLMGNARFMAENKVNLLPVANWIKVTAEAEEIAVFLAIEDKVEGLIALRDEQIADVGKTVDFLKRRGIKTVLLTSDSTALGEKLKKKLGFDEAVSNKTALEKNEYLTALRNSGREVLFITKPTSQTGRTKHDVLVFLLDHEPKLAAVPNEISTANGLSDLIYLFETADELHAGIFKSNKTVLGYTVLASVVSGGLYLFSPYAGVLSAALLRFADIPLYRKLVTTLEKYARNT